MATGLPSRLGTWFLVIPLAICIAQAQPGGANLSGTLRDPAGALVPGVELRVEHTGTALARQSVTDPRGRYHFEALPPGRYRLTARHEGFETQVLQGLELSLGESATLDLILRLGTIRESVTVEADTPLLEQERAGQSSHIAPLQVQNLPTDGRSYLEFTLLTPGVTDRHTLATERPVQAPTSGLSFAGQDQRSNRISIDGADNMDDISNSPRATLSQEAVQEFQISSSTYPAALGRARGGVINIVTKTGTNRFHGSGFLYLRDQSLDARNTFAKRQLDSNPRYERRQYGGTAGGPLKKDQTFFFASYEGLEREESLFVSFLDDPGIFEPSPSQQTLFEFLGTAGDPQLEALAAAFIGPDTGLLRTTPATFPQTLALLQEESGAFPFTADADQYLFRLDHRFSASNQFFGRFNLTDTRADNTNLGALEGVSNGVAFDVRDGGLVLGDLHVFSPDALNEFRFQYAKRDLEVSTNDAVGPEIGIAGVAELGREFLNPTRYEVDLFQLQDQFTRIWRGHIFKWGGDLDLRQRRGEAEVFLGGRFAFGEAIPLGAVLDQSIGAGSAQALALQLSTPTSQGGLGRPDLAVHLLAPISALQAFNFGLPLVYLQGFGDPSTDIPIQQLAVFFQDTWRVTDRLTLQLGLRYDTAWRSETLNLASTEAPFQFQLGHVNDHDNWAPRLGFAWTPGSGSRWVVRGGYGLYYQNVYGALEVTSQVLSGRILQVFLPLTGLPGIPVTSAELWAHQRQTGSRGLEALGFFGITPGTTPSIILPGDPGLLSPSSHQASSSVEWELHPDWALSLGYLFNSGVHLIRARDVNVRPLGRDQFQIPGLDPRFAQVPVMETSGDSVYHGMTVSLRKRFSRGYGFDLAYTLGRAIDDTTDFIIELGPHDHTNLRGERALSSFDQRHRLAISGVFQSPSRLDTDRPFRDRLLASWTLAPIVTFRTAKPFNLLSGFDRNGDTHEDSDRPLTVSGETVGRNTGRGPGFFAADLRVTRRIPLRREETALEFIFEAFNLFNNVNYSGVNNVVGNQLLDTSTVSGSSARPANRALGFTSAFEPRRLQFGLRFVF